jgi:tripartite ATP-independent transporter DctM subunit
MPSEIIGVIGLAVFILLMFLRVPIAFTFALVGGIGTIILVSYQAGITNFAVIPFSWATAYSFSCLPMFVLMGFVVAESGMASDLYSAAYKWLGRLPGGLAIASLIACAFFSALSGTAIAAAATIGSICYPEMRKYRYDPALASGVIATGATMDIMIPPSVPMIIYGMVSEVSVGKLFIAGFGPGVLEVILFSLFIFIMVKRNPSLAPLSAESYSFLEKIKGLKGVTPIIVIFIMVFGGLYGGIFTPTEAGAMGVIASIIVCLVMRRLTWRGLKSALTQSVRLTGTVFMILIGVMLFNTFIALSGLSTLLSEWVISMGISPIFFLVMVLLLYLPLGALMDEVSMMLLTIPFYMPAVKALGIDPVWFGILIILAWQIGLVAPPVGMIAFVTQSVLKEVSLQTVYKGCLPFILALIIVEIVVIFVPDVALFLLQVMK